MELSDLVLSPRRRAESVMCDRRHHEESGLGGVETPVQPVCALHVGLLPFGGAASFHPLWLQVLTLPVNLGRSAFE